MRWVQNVLKLDKSGFGEYWYLLASICTLYSYRHSEVNFILERKMVEKDKIALLSNSCFC